MNWKDFSIFKKLFVGFGFVLLLLVVSGLLSISGIKDILSSVDLLADNNHVKQLEKSHARLHVSAMEIK